MKLLDFLSEKAMNMATFSDTEKRLGDVARVGFEFEISVEPNSPYFSKNDDREILDISDFVTLDDFIEWFDAPRNVWHTIERDYENWKADLKDEFVYSNWMDFLEDSDDEDDNEEAARKKAEREWEKNYDPDLTFETWLDKEFEGDRAYFSSRYNLIPKYGWQDIANSLIYAEGDDHSDSSSVANTLADALEKIVNAKVVVYREYHERKKSLNAWYIEPDTSINSSGIGLEIVSPPQNLSKALSDMEAVCKFISDEKNGLKTNSSTGFHVNVSIPDISEKIDLLKLALFMGEKYSLELFNRIGNTYAEEHLKTLIEKIKENGKFPRGFDQMKRIAERYLSSDKYYSVNFGKLSNGNEYVEFRAAGGTGYERDIDRLKKLVLRFVTAVEIACDPSAERQEYVKKLVKLFNNAFDVNDNSTATSPHIPSELSRIVKLIPTFVTKRTLGQIYDMNSDVHSKRRALISLMIRALAAVKNINSDLTIKELIWFKRKAKEFDIKSNDVDEFFKNESYDNNSILNIDRNAFKTTYRI
jgi:hypothetical protein